jgi:SAM-dependent methyltransferase
MAETRYDGADDPHGQAHWDARYGASERVWSGRPNHRLVAEVSGLAPGRALDAGCGEGADALWLAGRGWRVTALDVSPVALARGAAVAAERGEAVAGRIAWRRADLRRDAPEPGAYDLVSAHFVHPAPDERPALVRRLADAVAPGGLLLYVGHDPSDPVAMHHRHAELLVDAPAVAALLDPDGWEIEAAEPRPRPGAGRDGRAVTHQDAVLRARRRS